ncbi:MAG: GNAT family N-acetyltransferase [Anaerolineales bacterium]|jgi:GNAT superfamily N-acetyltransferase
MDARLRKYQPESDFMRVRNFLVDTFSLTENPLNWKLERWNYAQYFITPMLATNGIGEPDVQAIKAARYLWNHSCALWENEIGEIVGVVNVEHADKNHSDWGEIFIQHHPDYNHLLSTMLAYAETNLFNLKDRRVFIPIYDYDDALIAAVQERGYHKNDRYTIWDSVYVIPDTISESPLPKGYSIYSMADVGSDIDKRRKAFGVGFNHPEPVDWPSRIAYQGLQQAPDYQPVLDIYLVTPDGEYGSFCIAWWDEVNLIACLEPVGTVPSHRRKGLARAVVFEAIRRVADLGARRVFVGSDQLFYQSIGFEPSLPAHHWERKVGV